MAESTRASLSPRMRGFVRDFESWLRKSDQGKANATVNKYCREVCRFIAAHGSPARMRAAELLRWRDSLETAAPRTINVKLAAISAAFEFCTATGLRPDDPTAGLLKMVKVPPRKPRHLQRDVIGQFFDALYSAEVNEVVLQDRALLDLIYGGGLRRSEAAHVKLSDIEGRNKLRVIGKGNSERYTLVTTKAYDAVLTWALYKLGDERTGQIAKEISADAAFDDLRRRKGDEYLFYTVDEAKVTRTPMANLKGEGPGHAVWRRCNHWFHRVGERATAHQFRHSFATGLLSGGADIGAIQKAMGTTARTAMGYIGTEDSLFERIKTAHPRG